MTRRRPAVSLIEVLVAVAVVAVLVGLVLAAVQKVRHAAARADCGNRLRQLATATHGHHTRAGRLPPGLRYHPDPLAFASWVTRCLPDLGEPSSAAETTEDFARSWAFDAFPPHRNLGRVLPAALCPLQTRTTAVTDSGATAAFTSYLGVSGTGKRPTSGVLFPDSGVRLADVTDGTSNTLLIGERPPGPNPNLGWWYAGVGQSGDGSADFLLGAAEFSRSPRTTDCPFGPYRYGPTTVDDPCSVLHFWSLHSGGANFAFCDGSVRFLRYSAAAILPALATRAGGEVVALD